MSQRDVLTFCRFGGSVTVGNGGEKELQAHCDMRLKILYIFFLERFSLLLVLVFYLLACALSRLKTTPVSAENKFCVSLVDQWRMLQQETFGNIVRQAANVL